MVPLVACRALDIVHIDELRVFLYAYSAVVGSNNVTSWMLDHAARLPRQLIAEKDGVCLVEIHKLMIIL